MAVESVREKPVVYQIRPTENGFHPESEDSTILSSSFDDSNMDWAKWVLKQIAGEPYPKTVDDYTNFSTLRRQVLLFIIQLFDQLLALLINTATATLFSVALVVFGPFSCLWERFFNWFKTKVTTKVSSFVTLSTPNIYDSLPQKEKKFNPSKGEFSIDNALFLLSLSTLVYEDNSVIDAALASLKVDDESLGHVTVMRESCVFHAFYSKVRGYVVLTFKGTSPLNFTEWLTDFTLSKVAADRHLIPGEVHEGFYNAFQFPSHIDTKSGSLRPPAHFERINFAIAEVLKQFDTKPNVWITGHSLGAALASVFFSYTICGNQDLFPVLDPLRRALVGAYTYGTPRTGNYVYDAEVTTQYKHLGKVFNRVINANDIVCRAPLGGNTGAQWLMSVVNNGRNLMSLTDYHHIGDSYFLPYYGNYQVQENPPFISLTNIIAYFFDNANAGYRFLTGKETLYSALTRQVTPFFLFDHFPSEYERHLAKHQQSPNNINLNLSFSLPKKDE